MEKPKKKKLKKRILTGFLSAAMAVRIAHGDMEVPQKEDLNSPVRMVFADEPEPSVKPEAPARMKAQEQKPTKTRLSMRSLTQHFLDSLRGVEESEIPDDADLTAEVKTSEAKPANPVRFLLQPFYPVLAFFAALFFTLVWPLPGLASRIKEKFRSSLSYHRFSLIAKGLSVLLVLAVYWLIPAERRGWLRFFFILWGALMLLLAIWSLFGKHRSDSVIVLVPDQSGEKR